MNKYILLVTVENKSGVLARVSSLFGRRGYNIASLTVSATTDENISRMSIIVFGDDDILNQIIKQLSKLEEVIKVDHLKEDRCYCSEQVFCKIDIKANKDTLSKCTTLSGLYGATIVETTDDYIITKLADMPSRIDEYLNEIKQFGIIEMCRSGVTAIDR